MRFQWRRLRPGELDHELIWLGVTVAGALGAWLWLSLQLPWPRCTFHALTGWPCLTCGATRAGMAFLHGHFGSAWQLNPLATVGFCAVALFDLYAVSVLATRAPRLRLRCMSDGMRQAVRIGLAAVVLVNWSYLFWRN